jgi:class 3 adenylate cyclase/tetratricopeptide (TPR) repeat protein
MISSESHAYLSYVPSLILRRLAVDPTPLPLPHREEFSAAVLFADISGFTALTERLVASGPSGVEQLTQILNDYFGRIIEVVTGHGGDVVKFAGDALLALWQGVPGIGQEELATLVLRAGQCALEIQAAVAGWKTGSLHIGCDGAAEEVRLSLRIAISGGEVRCAHVGGVFGRCEFVLAGEPLVQVGEAGKHVAPGEVVVAAPAWELVQAWCAGTVLPSGHVQLDTVLAPRQPCPLELPTLGPEAIAAVRGYLPAAVRSRLDAGQTGWISELRQVSVIFLNLTEFKGPIPLDYAQRAMCDLQQALYRYEGSINKLSIDDKGVTFVAALGLPPLAHENDPVRAVRAALGMRAKLALLNWNHSLGVATGRAFCGAYGSPLRREYTMIGDVVNLSARLMQAAHGGILCDSTTWRASRDQVHFETLPAIRVKGKAAPIPVFRPHRGTLPPGGAEQGDTATARSALVGRVAERTVLREALRCLADERRGGVVVLEGEAGVGKSRLVADLLDHCRAGPSLPDTPAEPSALSSGRPGFSPRTLVGGGDAIERATPYYAWRAIFQQLFHIDGIPAEPEAARQQVLRQLDSAPELVPLAPLLSVVVGWDWADNEFTAQMTGEVRGDNTNRLLVRLLAQAAETGPLLLILEDTQWFDSPSWALTREILRDVDAALLILTTRPPGDPAPPEYAPLRRAAGPAWLRLEVLGREESAALVCQRLGVQLLTAEAAALIHGKAQGHPYFSEELACALLEQGVLEIEDGECQLAPGALERAFDIPNNVQGAITSRVDRLSPQQQLALKVASVIGRVFSLRLLSDAYPIEDDRTGLPDVLRALERLELVQREESEERARKVGGASLAVESSHRQGETVYAFKQTITIDVVYGLMLDSQRQALHRTVAEWYERIHAGDLAPHYPLLAYHWAKAEAAERAIDYFEKAGEQALRTHADEEAIDFFGHALRLASLSAGHGPLPVARTESDTSSGQTTGQGLLSDSRRARWERQLGEAHYSLGNMGQSLRHFEAALVLMGMLLPRPGWRLGLGALGAVCRQVLHRVWPGRFLGRAARATRGHPGGASVDARETCLEAARCHERLAQIYYLNNAKVPCLHAVFRTLNLAEVAGPSPELARAYANASVLVGLLSAHGSARAYVRRARETAEQVDQLPCSTYVLEVVGIYWYGVGEWEKAREALGAALALAERIGELRRWDEIFLPWAMLPYHRGDLELSAKLAEQMYDSARRRGIAQVQAWALSWQLVSLLPRDPDAVAARVEEVIGLLEALLVQAVDSPGALVRADEVMAYGVLAQAYWRRGDRTRALRAADAAAQRAAGSEPTSHYVHVGYAGMAEVYLGLWEERGLRGPSSVGRAKEEPTSSSPPRTTDHEPPVSERELARRAWDACQALRRFARMHPLGWPLAHLYEGLHAWLSGQPRRAGRAWRRCLSAAEDLGMPLEQGQAYHHLARRKDRDRQGRLLRAAEVFQQVGADYDLARVKRAQRTKDQ